MKTDLCILAAGNSSRFKSNKLIFDFKNKPLIVHLFEKIDVSLFENIIVITQYKEIEELSIQYGFDVVINNRPELGIAYSISLGVQLCNGNRVMFLVADQPFISKTTINRMLMRDEDEIIAVSVEGDIFNPMIFPKKYFDELQTLQGDKGGKQVALKHDVIKIPVDKVEIMDIDTMEDMSKIIKMNMI